MMRMLIHTRAPRLFLHSRQLSTVSSSPPRFSRLARVLVLSSALTTSALGYAFYTDASSTTPASSDTRTLSDLVRAYVTYGMCSIPVLVDASPTILDVLFGIPGVNKVAQCFVRATFFRQFVGADTADGVLPLLATLSAENKGIIFTYNVEVDQSDAVGHNTGEKESVHERIVKEIITSINVAADFEDRRKNPEFGGKTCVAIKLTGMLSNAQSLINLSTYLTHTRAPLKPPVPFPGTPFPSDLSILHSSIPTGALTESDIHDLKELYNALVKICKHAADRGVRVLVDAEHSWYQPAIDAFGHALMEKFNKLPTTEAAHHRVQPVVYVTYQAYLRRTPAHLAHSIALARARGYALGVKLVRGAYHPYELAAHQVARSTTTSISPTESSSFSISPDLEPPVQPSKEATDQCYNTCAAFLVDAISSDIHRSGRSDAPGIGVLFGTHNWTSCEFILEEIVKKGLGTVERAGGGDVVRIPPEVAERITFAQLYGMSDALTNHLVSRMQCEAPCVLKCVPYGALVEVMPYLSRRAIENKSVLGAGNATRERKEAAALIWKRMKGLVGL
ncbi:FAD-linked oxidoreductase [Rhizopogon vinicolor AM-OR11-026]|uniref:Proline dehydrogenase n=1 Tax=Rhizopogon vinicolor AM-OR11-026 TaxID=1314800 RepID=A0A1B7N6K8_9AGAM|nr:FAD-linked oxidoreductase [Rhizopogon vinicolor AM-OR11-026]